MTMIDGDRPPTALVQYSGFLLNWVAARSRARFAEALAGEGLHLREFAALNIVAARPGLTQQDLAAAAEIDASTLVATLDGLEQRGLAERRILPEDRRKRAIHLTPAGEAALARGRALAGELGDELFGALSADERRRFDVLLRKLAGVP
ncbi:MAG TPA: MarR family transcriptional regulator [Conexibacter sp.]|jgi:DNA-binding MarR family transcriptional regulator|nr:MarR family transcriptional regulator [Conexibacter sp.]